MKPWLPIFPCIVQTILFIHYCLFQSHTLPFLFVKAKFLLSLFSSMFSLLICYLFYNFPYSFTNTIPFLTKQLAPSSASRVVVQEESSLSLCAGLACRHPLHTRHLHIWIPQMPPCSLTLPYFSEQDHPFVWFTYKLVFFKDWSFLSHHVWLFSPCSG